MGKKCSKCGRTLGPGEQAYRLLISLVSDFDGVITDDSLSDAESIVEETKTKTEGVPSDLLEEEVHKEFSFMLCPQCKERYCANPLNLPLRGIIIPETIPEPEDE